MRFPRCELGVFATLGIFDKCESLYLLSCSVAGPPSHCESRWLESMRLTGLPASLQPTSVAGLLLATIVAGYSCAEKLWQWCRVRVTAASNSHAVSTHNRRGLSEEFARKATTMSFTLTVGLLLCTLIASGDGHAIAASEDPTDEHRSAQTWITWLKDSDPSKRERAGYALSRLGREAEVAVPDLIELLKSDSNAIVRLAAVSALGWIGPGAKDAVPVLAKLLRREIEADDRVRWRAALSLGQIGSPSLAVVPELTVAMVEDHHQGVVHAAGFALWKLGDEAIPVLGLALIYPRQSTPNDETEGWYEPEDLLAEHGARAVPLLVELLRIAVARESETTKKAALEDLLLKRTAFSGAPSVERLVSKAVNQFGADNRFKIRLVLSAIGREATRPLVALLASPDESVKNEALRHWRNSDRRPTSRSRLFCH